jgi:ABC-type antimicrobial peptide transport system permease subunit
VNADPSATFGPMQEGGGEGSPPIAFTLISRSCKSALALLLSLIGLYGVMSFVVTRRTREIGIRLALGGTGASAIRLVLRDAVVMIAVGIVVALPCVAALGKLIQSQLFGVTGADPATVAAAPRHWRACGSIHPGMASFEREPHGRATVGIAQIPQNASNPV